MTDRECQLEEQLKRKEDQLKRLVGANRALSERVQELECELDETHANGVRYGLRCLLRKFGASPNDAGMPTVDEAEEMLRTHLWSSNLQAAAVVDMEKQRQTAEIERVRELERKLKHAEAMRDATERELEARINKAALQMQAQLNPWFEHGLEDDS